MEYISSFLNGHQGGLRLDYLPCVNYSMMLNKVNTCTQCEVENHDGTNWQGVTVGVSGEFMKPCKQVIDFVEAGQRVQIAELKIEPLVDKLLNMTEMVDTSFTITIAAGEEVLLTHDFPISLMAFDQWTGTSVRPELLASFVTPNHPLISSVIVKASQYMEKWTGSSAMDEYQTQDRHRARLQVAAIYEALREQALVYVTPPASFEPMGQRVRLADKVLSEKLGTCLDTTLLFASCLEAVGLFPILVLLKGHAFVGAWIAEDIYAQNIGDDASFLLKKCADGVNDIVLVETTAVASSKAVTFDEAVKQAVVALKEEERFQLFVDVHRCRLSNVKPLPQRIELNGRLTVENEGVKHEQATKQVQRLDHYALKIDEDKQGVTKQTIWERKLLDFSLRNNLINAKLGKRLIPFVSFGIDRVEDELQDGKSFAMQPFPKTQLEPTESGMYDSMLQVADLEALAKDELKNKRLISFLTETELKNAVKFLYRMARTTMEENGANSLFLALGLLKWYESEKSVQPRYAPILLLPVDLVRKGGDTGYVIRSRDEDMILNITLIELLKQQFHINLKGLNPLPTDEHGVDVKQVFAALRQYLTPMKRWNVLEETMLGLFSFNKFVMWNDIHSNASKLKMNPVIATLMESQLKWKDNTEGVDSRMLDKSIKPQRYAIPLDVDSSQMEAVIDSGDGKSFILHGPPGTGKSQTITNMIANALYQGKRVLFVAEKMAALEVVQKRLKKIGLDAFCLEMHSNKMTKQHFLTQMQMALDAAHIKSPQEFESAANQLYEHRLKMINNIEALHKVLPSGLSLYDYIIRYLSIKYDDELLDNLPDLKLVNVDKLNEWEDSLRSLDAVFQLIGHPVDHPLRGLEPHDARLETTSKVKETLQKYGEAFAVFKDAVEVFAKKLFDTKTDDSMDEAEGLVKFVSALQNAYTMNGNLLKLAADQDFRKDFSDVVGAGRKRDLMKQQLLRQCSDSILSIKPEALRKEWDEIQQKWFLPKFFAKRSYMKKMQAYDPHLKPEEVLELLENVDIYQKNEQQVNENLDLLKGAFDTLVTDQRQDWTKIEQSFNAAPQVIQFLVDFANNHDRSYASVKELFLAKTGSNLSSFKQQYGDEMKELQNLSMLFKQQTSMMATFAHMKVPSERISTSIPNTLERWMLNFDKVKNWCQWVNRKRELEAEHLHTVCKYIEDEHMNGAQAAQALLKGIYHQLILMRVDSDEQLRMFNGVIFSELIEKYRQETAAFQELTKKELYCRLAANVPSQTMEAAANSEMGILKRNIANGGRGTTIRKIIDQIPTLLPRLCPCMLMSPISVAQYIDLDRDKFDIVVFDEASQMPTSEAVGAIARGKALVVVGDPMQMPPTSFFSTSAVDEEEAELDDMDSILDDCITLSIPSRYLTWHYRSKHESLIAFSNSQYYDGRLYTFPSIDDRLSKVTLVQIEGTYDKGRTRSNPSEAREIVYEVIRRLSDEELSKYSIGIVAFSKVQQSLIEDYLEDELAKHPDLELKANQGDEPIFIKNLENVQGDERDVILFSVGYGPDKNGHVSMNFGPLNNEGGERRLNVAVSRARYEMMVFSTLKAEQIDLRRSNAKGVVGLKRFLEFAAKGMQVLPTVSTAQMQASEIINELAEALESRGYQVDKMVGKSNFRIDLAVVDPRDSDKYLLGILTDGPSYYNTKTTRDREICQPNVLRMLKWNYMRVWSVDWFQDKERVLNSIIEELNFQLHPELMKRKRHADEPTQQKLFSVADEPVAQVTNLREKMYKTAALRASTAQPDIERVIKNAARVKDQLTQIITVEQPVTNNYLYKRIATLWNMQRVTPRLQSLVDSMLPDFYLDPLSDGINNVYWMDKVVAFDYSYYRVESKRDIADVPVIELMNAALYAIEQQISIPREDLKKVISTLLGFSRKGANVDQAAEKAINQLLNMGKLKEENGKISINN